MTGQNGSWQDVYADIARVVIPRQRIAERIRGLSREIAARYAGKELVLVGVLTGSLIFLADLIRTLPLQVRLRLVAVSSYPGTSVESQGPRVTQPPLEDLSGRHVLLVDDILDGGGTLRLLTGVVTAMSPASFATCVLLCKQRDDRPDRIEADYVGFQIPDEFVVGYGLDFDDRYRNLPDICVLQVHAREAQAGGPP